MPRLQCAMLACNRDRLTLLWVIAVLFLGVAATGVQAENLEALKSSVVRIVSPSPEGKRRIGTGFVVKVEGDLAYIVTASHVVEGDSAPEIEFYGRRHRWAQAGVAKLEGGNPMGIALLTVRDRENLPQDLPALAFAPSRDVQGGEDVMVIGFGQHGDWGVIRAYISSVERDFRLDGRIEEGNSGAPVVKDGRVVALVTSATRGLGLATPSLFVEEILKRWGVNPDATQTARPRLPSPSEPIQTSQPEKDRYLLVNADAKVGRVTQQSKKLELRDGVPAISDGTRVSDGDIRQVKVSMTLEQVATTEVLAVNDGYPVKVRRTLDKLSLRSRFEKDGKEAEEHEEVPVPLDGKTIIATRQDGAWRLVDHDQERSQVDLGTQFDSDWAYPREPVPVGHHWALTREQVRQFVGTFLGFADFLGEGELITLGLVEGEVDFKLERIVDCGADRCAEVTAKISVTGSLANPALLYKLEGSGKLLRSLRDHIDQESELSGRWEMGDDPNKSARAPMILSGPFRFAGQASVR